MTCKTIISELKYEKLACFDLDFTLIKPRSGKKFPKDKDDWCWNFHSVPKILRKLYENEYTIIVFTNQKNLKSYSDFKYKIDIITERLNIPINYFISTSNDKYRKPCNNMFIDLENMYPCVINKDQSFYCGDACGRSHDFSDSDLLFAHNINLTFKLPEIVFEQNHNYVLPAKKTHPLLDYISNPGLEQEIINKINVSLLNRHTCIINIGFQASGKSFFSNNISNLFNTFNILNNDTFKNKSKLQAKFNSLVNTHENIIIDNTNPDYETRKYYVDILKSQNYNIIYVWFDLPLDVVFYLNNYRKQILNKNIPTVAYNIYKKKFDKPNLDENIDSIIKIINVYGLREDSHIFNYLF